jgi:hypothetical protein
VYLRDALIYFRAAEPPVKVVKRIPIPDKYENVRVQERNFDVCLAEGRSLSMNSEIISLAKQFRLSVLSSGKYVFPEGLTPAEAVLDLLREEAKLR